VSSRSPFSADEFFTISSLFCSREVTTSSLVDFSLFERYSLRLVAETPPVSAADFPFFYSPPFVFFFLLSLFPYALLHLFAAPSARASSAANSSLKVSPICSFFLSGPRDHRDRSRILIGRGPERHTHVSLFPRYFPPLLRFLFFPLAPPINLVNDQPFAFFSFIFFFSRWVCLLRYETLQVRIDG